MTCFIIAEAGVNHNGDIALAHRLVDAAADAGADAVKFQTFRAEKLVTAAAAKASYQVATTGTGPQIDMLRALELAPEAHAALKNHAEDRGLLFASTAFDIESVDFLDRLGVPFHKIPSGEITNFPLVRHIARKAKPTILSTGMSTLEEVRAATGWLATGPQASSRLPALTVLHCVTAYPAPPDHLNLRCIETLARELGVPAGYSDHSTGIEMPIAATALGASVVEKHFTLDRTLPGPDHAASLEPDKLATMVGAIRNVARALGDGAKIPAPSEAENRDVIRRAIVARRPIRRGEIFTDANLDTKRPATGLSAALWPDIVGRAAPRDFRADEPIEI
jgi:N-acetylneuraminate synthase